jgi:hypothetical protein
VLSQTAGGVRGLAEQLQNAEGTAARTAKEMDAGLGGAMRITMSAIEGTALAIGDALAPRLQKLIELIGNAAGSVTAYVKANAGMVVSIAKGVAMFTAAGVAALTLGTAISILSGAFATLLAATSAIVAPIAAAAAAMTGLLLAFAAATVKVVAYGAASVTAAAAATGAWLVANAAMLGMVGFLGLIAVNVLGVLGGMKELGHAATNAAQAGRDAMAVFMDMGKTANLTFRGIAESLNANNIEGAMAVGMEGLKAVFTRGATAFMNAVDEWGVNLVNTFDFYISQIPFLRFLGKDTYKFSVFGDSTEGNNADTRADQRGAAMLDRRQQRDDTARGVFDKFDQALQDARATNRDRLQSRDLGGRLDAAKTNQELIQLGFALTKLKDSGRVAAEEIAKLEAAYDNAAERLSAPTNAPEARPPAGRSSGFSLGQMTDEGLADSMTGAVSDDPLATKKNVFEEQATSVLRSLADSWSAAEIKDAIGEARALIQTKAVGRGTASQLEAAIEAATKVIDPRAIEDQARQMSPADVVGTFSGAALGQMGFGQGLAQKQLDVMKQIEQNTREPMAGLVAD